MGNARSTNSGRLVDYGFFAALLAAGYLLYRTVESVLVPTVLGAFAAVLARPTVDHLSERLHGRRRLASGATTSLVVLLVLIPAVFIGAVLVQELIHVAQRIALVVDRRGLEGLLLELRLPRSLRDRVSPAQLETVANAVVARLGTAVGQIVGAAASLAVGLFLFIISLYYFLVDGPRWLHDLSRILPMRAGYVRAFAREFSDVSYALFYGSLLTALVQGAVAALGYLIFGVPQPVLWGATTAVLSLTPIVGTMIVWLPMGLILIASGSVSAGIGVMVWNMVLTGSVDNLVRPLFMRGRMRLHPLVVFLALIGGVTAFGVVGLLIGPLAAALFLAGVRIYDRDYRARLDPEGA